MSIQKMLLLLVALGIGVSAAAQTAVPAVSPAARRIEDSAIVVDTHADTPMRFVDQNFDPANDAGVYHCDVFGTSCKGHWDFTKARAANLGVEFFSIWVDPRKYQGHYTQRALDMIDSVYLVAHRHPDQMMMSTSVADVERARSGPNKRLAAFMGLEGGHSIQNDIRVLRDFYRLGVRYMTLTWANSNEFADSSGDINNPKVQHHDGLTEFGKQVVAEMNRLGMMVDISHVSDKTFWDTLAVTKAPVIASHSSARALTNSERDMTDDMLRAMAKNGGVVQVNFNCGFIDEPYRKAEAALDAQRHAANHQQKNAQPSLPPPPRPPFNSLIDHFDHIAKVAGIDHVGVGSDFDGVDCLPQGIDSVADLPRITQALLDRGYTADQIKKILGGNLLRVMGDVERVSRQLQAQPRAAVPSAVK